MTLSSQPADKVPHLLACISGHGYGHVAQTAPVLNALRQRLPELLLTVRSQVPLAHLQSRIRGPFRYLRDDSDIGMLMSSALDVQVNASAEAYLQLHRDWGLRVTNEARLLREIAPDFVLSNVGYLPLAGAYRAGIPAAAMSSLNWGEIHAHYCGAISGALHVTEQIRLSYANAEAFLQLEPAMQMDGLPNLVKIGPVAETGRKRSAAIRRFFSLSERDRLVLVSLGGVSGRLPMETWPRIPNVRWLVQSAWRANHPDALMLEALEMDFGDILASSDALICKPGYGSFVEAACAGVPVVYAGRPDWPETPCLAAWLHQHGVAVEVSRRQLESGDLGDALQQVWQTPHPALPAPTGAAQAADWLAGRLRPPSS